MDGVALTLVTGPANSAKAGEVLGAYGAAVRRGALLVVPTAQDARHYERELVGTGIVLGTVLTFDGLVGVIAQRAGYAEPRLSALQRERVLAGVLGQLGLDALRASARGAGFELAAGELIAELQRSLITPQRFAAALRAWAAQDVRRAAFTRDLGRIYGAYARELDRLGRVDRERFAWRALDALRAEPRRWARPTPDAVFVYGFDDLTPLERDVLQTLARIPGVAVTVSLTYEPGRTALLARAETVEELRPLAEQVIELPARDDYYEPASRAVLHRLERDLFQDDAAPAGLDHDGSVVTLLEAGGERAEAELVAAEVRGLLEAGTPAPEIVVVHRSPGRAAGLFARVFGAYGIELSTLSGGEAAAGGPAFGHTPLGAAALGAARCAWLGDAATAADLLAYLRAPGLLREPDLADRLEAEIRRTGPATAAQARERLGWELGELDSLAAAADPAGELCRLARRLLAAPHREAAAQLDADEELDARAVAALVRACDELAQLPGAGAAPARIAPAQLIELLAAIPVTGGPGPAGAGRGAVSLADPAQIRARRFRAVFVCGLQEGEFPGPGSPEPFLSDERRRELALASGLRLRPREDALDGERYLFYAAVSRATERVFLAYRSSDEEGNLALASPFIGDVAAVLGDGWRARRRRRMLAEVTWPADRAPTERERARAQAAARAPLVGDAPAPERRLGAAALSHVRHSRIVSAGALERYSDCPVRWLVEGQLEPAPLAPEPAPLARGTLIHAMLERLIAELDGPVTPATLERAEAILQRLIDELTPTADAAAAALGVGEPAVVRAGALRAIEADLRRYLRHEAATGGPWRPYGLELRFGFDAPEGDSPSERSLPALVLGEGEDAVRVRGVVDRIDVDPAGRAVVRDYKSGAPQANWPVARWSEDRRLQVALYMLVARDLIGLDVVAGVYQPLRGEDLRARGVFIKDSPPSAAPAARDARSAPEIDAELAGAAQRAIALAARLRSGELTPCPQTCSRDGCAHPAICRSR